MRFLKRINNYSLPYSTSEYEDNSDPLYGESSGREALDGEFVGTFVGNFPGIVITFPAMSNTMQRRFKQECKKTPVELEWWDSTKGDYVVSSFYPGPMKSKVLFVREGVVYMHPFIMQFTTIKKE